MVNAAERLMVSIPAEMKSEIDAVKQREFYDQSYVEMYRQIIRLGLDKMREDAAKEHNPSGPGGRHPSFRRKARGDMHLSTRKVNGGF